jgi:3-oxoacyl-[acyl-carrier-protein] synthase-1
MCRGIPTPSARPIAIQSHGIFTSAGTRFATAFGSARLNLKFFEELPWNDAGGVPVIGARTPLDLFDVAGVDRLATMAVLALSECASAGAAAPPGRSAPPATPLLLCLPEPHERPFDPRALLNAICAETGTLIDATASRTYATGRAAIFDALEEAGRLLATRAVSTVYVGGVDSLVDRDPFDRLARAGRLKTTVTEGFFPGEGAAFLRLGRGDAPGAIATIAGMARAEETCTRDGDQPNVGAGLADAASAALAAAALPVTQIGGFIHDASGDRFGFREVTMAITRLRPRADPAPAILTTGACSGELGAAFGPFALGMAAFFLHRNIDAGPATLVLGTSDGTKRGAAVVTRNPPQRS